MKRVLSRINITVIIALTIITASCSKSESQDIEALLATVPTDASIVGVANISSILEEGGCKIDGSKIKPSTELQNAIASIENTKNKEIAETIIDGKSGLRPTVCAFFTVGSSSFMTGLLDNSNDFKSLIERRTSGKFVDIHGVDVCEDYAVVGDQFWIATGYSNQDIATRVAEFTKLSKQQSYLSGENADSFINMEDDVRIAVDIAGTINNLPMDFKERAMFSTILNTLFKDATYSLVTLNFNKEKVDLIAKVLDSKGNVADFNLPTAKIDSSTIEKLGGTADIFTALAISPRLVDKIKDIVKSLSGLVPASFTDFLTPIDGTSVFATSATEKDFRALITTNGKPSNELTSILSSAGKIDKDGKYIIINQGADTGNGIPAKEAAKLMKGNFGATMMASHDKFPYMKYTLAAITPDGKGISVKIQAISTDDNAVKALLKYASERK